MIKTHREYARPHVARDRIGCRNQHGKAMDLDDQDPLNELPARPRETILDANRELLELAALALGAI